MNVSITTCSSDFYAFPNDFMKIALFIYSRSVDNQVCQPIILLRLIKEHI